MQRFPLFTRTLTAVGTVNPHRFARADGAQAGAGDIPLGITPPDIQEVYAVTLLGDEILEAGEAFSAGELLAPDAEGRGIRASTGYALATDDATAAGDLVSVMLLQPGSVRPVYYDSDGAIAPKGVALITGGTGIGGLTLAAPQPGQQVTIRVDTLDSGSVVLTLAEGATFDDLTSNTATFDAIGEELVLRALDDVTWKVIKNTGAVALSAV
ncbi:capsid cement protein [Marichromatium sp. AB31]|uniref:capsid cement protein n=1 Tax=Marichromatium sp. AB31 TaxID=2483362 RepID=UPI000F3B9907|nr:capsid cement protein [Marichromatium sp. AB31]RNE89871.1 hypothetical protein EBL84_09290 [Marichromatium sp. AB31]